MSDPREYKTEAIIIKKTKLGEADTILTFFTPRLGKIQGFAKSLRKPKSKLAGHLELLTHSLVSFARGRNIDTVTGSQTINSFLPLRNDLWLTSCGVYIAELVNQFTAEREENLAGFGLLLATLGRLDAEADNELVLRYFELHLLESAGYRPQLHQCTACHGPLEPIANYFSPAAGGLLCPDCGQAQAAAYPLSLNAQKVLRLLQLSPDFGEVSRLRIDSPLSGEIDEVLRGYLRHLLEREVRSVAWLDELREMTRIQDAIDKSNIGNQTSKIQINNQI
jgi:DNA repair protein RecO (recombination protein O)